MQDEFWMIIYLGTLGNKKGCSVKTPTKDLEYRLKNLEYRKLYGSELVKADLALTLSKARRKLKMTQKQFADELKLSQPYIAKIESGAANPTIGAVGSMLAVIGLSLITDIRPLLAYTSLEDSISMSKNAKSALIHDNVISLFPSADDSANLVVTKKKDISAESMNAMNG